MAVLAPVLKQRFFDSNGDPLVGGKLYTYAAGTTTNLATYTDQTGSSTNTNPIILDANGEADVWITEAGYKFALFDSSDVPQWTVDNVYSSAYAQSTSADLIDNLSIGYSVGAGQLTISLKDAAGNNPSVASTVKVGFRSSTLISGVIQKLVASAPLSTIISAGSTAGHTSAVSCPLYVGLMNVSGVMELCWSSSAFDEKGLISTTAEGGAGAADSASTIYSTTARSNVPARIVGKAYSTQATAGTWAAVPTVNIVGDVGKILSMPASIPQSPYTFGNSFLKTGPTLADPQWGFGTFGEYAPSVTSTYTAKVTDGFIPCSGSAFTVTLPTAVGNNGKILTIIKTDASFSNIITIDGNASETIDGALTTTLNTQYEAVTLVSDNANWSIVERKIPNVWTAFTPTGSWNTNVTYSGFYKRVGDSIIMDVTVTCSGAPNATTLSINLANSLVMDTAKMSLATAANISMGQTTVFDAGTDNNVGRIKWGSSTTIIPEIDNVSGTYSASRSVTQALPITFGASDTVHILTRPIPIAGWKG